MIRWTRATVITLASIVIPALLFAWFAWQRRWMSDDGLIFVRIVHQILDGHGPVYNAFERAEANTSALWPWLLALLGAVTRAPIAYLAVGGGLVLSLAGLVLALDGTRRWHVARGETTPLVPLGVIVPLAAPPFWDYATSGLETGLTTCWLGLTWWLFVTLAGASPRRQLVTAIAFGLGPLVRPDLGIVSVVFLIAAWWRLRPARRRTLVLAVAAGALPVAYEVFRMGYYGTLVPLPALAKGATGTEWSRGWAYLLDFVEPTWLWIPLAVSSVLLGVAIARRSLAGDDRVMLAAPLASALLMALYVLRVGGDFMHARMWLPATFLAVCPGMLVPWRRVALPAIAVVALWGIVIEHTLADSRVQHTGALIEDERLGYLRWTKNRHPISESVYVEALQPISNVVADTLRAGRREIISEGGERVPLSQQAPASFVFVAGRLGAGGVVTPVDAIVADTLGLANPLGARITVTRPDEAAGHQKSLPWAWLIADFADPTHLENGRIAPAEVRAAAHAMQCGELAELLASVREPMSVSRFFANLVGSFRRTRLVVPADPYEAERTFCGSSSQIMVTVSSSCEQWGWAKDHAADGFHRSSEQNLGYSSQVWIKQDHPEWIAVELPAARAVTNVVLYPRTDEPKRGMGFPIDFAIQSWDGHAWVDRVTKTAFPRPSEPQTFSFSTPVITTKIRILATKLDNVPADDYVMQFAEIEVL